MLPPPPCPNLRRFPDATTLAPLAQGCRGDPGPRPRPVRAPPREGRENGAGRRDTGGPVGTERGPAACGGAPRFARVPRQRRVRVMHSTHDTHTPATRRAGTRDHRARPDGSRGLQVSLARFPLFVPVPLSTPPLFPGHTAGDTQYRPIYLRSVSGFGDKAAVVAEVRGGQTSVRGVRCGTRVRTR